MRQANAPWFSQNASTNTKSAASAMAYGRDSGLSRAVASAEGPRASYRSVMHSRTCSWANSRPTAGIGDRVPTAVVSPAYPSRERTTALSSSGL
jgi:hypothetical protein